jgi:AraC family transcriptional regulator, transcriptional activator of pobA
MRGKNRDVNEPPIFDLHAFGKKASIADFYIQTLQDHLKEHKFINKPHKHDFYLILFVVKGGGIHTIDFKDYKILPNSVFLMTPGQVHSWQLEADADGFIIFFTKGFYQMQSSERNLLEFPFYHSLSASPSIVIGKDEVIDFMLRQLQKEFRNNAQSNLRLLRSYLDVLLLKLSESFPGASDEGTNATTFKLRRLEQLIEKNFRKLKQPSDYADLMNLSASYLNSICKDNLNKTLSELIQGRIILEAKRMFAYSDANVNEIASKLNFNDVSYFSRFFRKHTGNAPEAFRSSLNKVDHVRL